MMIGKLIESKADMFYFVFRIIVGVMFLLHGIQKLFGAFGGVMGNGEPVALMSLMGLAGIIEFLAGMGIATGFFTRLSALGGIIVMIGAQATVHLPQGINPFMNQGELSLVYLAAFLVLLVNGARKWSLENAVLKKEIF